MSFRPARRRPPVIPLVSLIDILTILLIFFLVTTTFKKKTEAETKEAALQVTLPSASHLTAQPAAPEKPVPLVLNAAGKISLGEVVLVETKPADEADRTAARERLATALTDLRTAQPAARLELRADQAADLGSLVLVWDALHAAGVNVTTDVRTKILLQK
jgi:biopolymer transport protein ExbD